jgi:hypothetical protein
MAPGCHPWRVDLSEDLPPPRRPLFFPVVIATIFLTIIGMSAGLALGARHKHLNAGDQPQNNVPVVNSPTEATSAPTLPPGAKPCTSHTQEIASQYGAQGELAIVLKLRTAKSTAWICRDATGALFYHANRGGEFATWQEGSTALFLTGVRAVGDEYVVTAKDGVTFRITSRRLEIVHKNGVIETQAAAK